MIAWTYLDKKAAAVEALKDYSAMEFIIQGAEDVEKELRESMTSIRSSLPSETPRTSNPKSGEERLAARIDEIDVLKERYRSAVEYMAWFRPAWEELSEDDRYILRAFYGAEERQNDVIGNLCNHFHIERTSAYNRKNRALTRLAILLYGKR